MYIQDHTNWPRKFPKNNVSQPRAKITNAVNVCMEISRDNWNLFWAKTVNLCKAVLPDGIFSFPKKANFTGPCNEPCWQI
jgi:hypothetical protein